MLKFFRRYNKAILAVGASILMIAFLIQPVITIFLPDGADRVVGTMHGEEVTIGQVGSAAAELQVLQRLGLGGFFGDDVVGDDAERWLAVTRQAQAVGLNAGEAEVSAMLQSRGITPEDTARALAGITNGTQALVRQAVRHWLMAQQYRTLAAGVATSPTDADYGHPALRRYALRMEALQQMRQYEAMVRGQMTSDLRELMMTQQRSEQFLIQAQGSGRLSSPLIQRILQEQMAQVGGAVMVVPASAWAPQVQPDEALVQELFETYGDVPAGQGEPYGIGYRLPDRITAEYLVVPREDVLAYVQDNDPVRFSQVADYYERHRRQYAPTAEAAEATGASDMSPEVETEIRDVLLTERVDRLALDVVREAQQVLLDDARGLPTDGELRDTTGYEPPSLDTVAQTVAERTGIRPQVRRTEQGIGVDQLAEVPGLGEARVSPTDLPVTRYVQQTAGLRDASEDPDARMRGLRPLQPLLPSEPMRDPDGNAYVLRLTQVQPAVPPDSLDDVREQVVADATRIAAYRQLTADVDQLRQRVADQGLETVSDQLGATYADVPPTRRMQPSMFGASVPEIQGIADSEHRRALLAKAFDTGEHLRLQGLDPADAPVADRLVTQPLGEALSLALMRVDSQRLITRSQFAATAQNPYAGPQLQTAILADQQPIDPLSEDVIFAQVGFERDED
jgi:hypothetical protein